MEEIPAPPTEALLRKLIAIADDVRGDEATRKVAKRKLRLYAKYYPHRVKRKNDPLIHKP